VIDARIDAAGEGRLLLSGDLDFATVGDLLQQARPLLADRPSTVIDLADVRRANSAGLALLLEWLAEARREGRELKFANLPPSLTAIAELSHLTALLPLTTSDS